MEIVHRDIWSSGRKVAGSYCHHVLRRFHRDSHDLVDEFVMNAISQVAFYCNRNTVILRLARDLIVAPIYVVWEDLDPLCISRSVSVYQDLDLAQDTYSQAADVSSLPMRARCAARWSVC